jgi:CIC family chloride channel protein
MNVHQSDRVVVTNPLRWFPELWESHRRRVRPQARLLGLSLLVGVISGIGAIVFFTACQLVFHYALDVAAGYHPTAPGGEPPLWGDSDEPLRPWFLVLIPTIGGLVSGYIVFTLAPEAEGHGTDAAIAAYHFHQGQIRARVPIIKLIASAITLGTGGSGGREGPIAQIGAGFGSFLGTILKLGPQQRRILMAAGMGAGIAAIFRAPLAGALFAAEVLYSSPDFESDVIIPATLASVVAYSTFGAVFGWSPLFVLPPGAAEILQFNSPLQLLSYTLLAIFSVLLATIYVRSFYGLTHLFHRIPIRPRVRPAIGAGLSGLVALALYFGFQRDKQVLAVLSFGYGILQDAMMLSPKADASVWMGCVLLAVALGKILTTGLTIGSGGSGGVFGPSMVIGGCGGGALGIWLHAIEPALVPHPTCFVIVGMAGFFAATAKTPFSTLVIVSEMTGSYGLLLPTLWVCAIAFVLSDEQSLYSAQVEKRSLSPAHQGEYVREVLGNLRVRELMLVHAPPLLHPEDRLSKIIDSFGDDFLLALPVVDPNERLLGVVSVSDVYLALRSPDAADLLLAADLMRSDVAPVQADERLDRALELFVESGLPSLPVADAADAHRVIGIVKRVDVSKAYLQYVHGPPAVS